ncbi:hypothetical protein EOL70_11625 [Leucothrix sargassi]|nr:hypothetical protein EOL70_11625 [Leucothrix sargassi]
MRHVQTYCKSLKVLTIALFLSAFNLASAEDTEIFKNEALAEPPNLLVILDNSGSMTNEIEGTGQTRMEALGEAFETFISNPDVLDVNIGLMAFSNGNESPRPHGVSVPVTPVDDEITPIMLSNLIPTSESTGDNLGFFSLADDNLPDPVSGQTVRQYLPQVVNSWTASGGTPIVDALHEAALYFKGSDPKWGYAHAAKVNAAHPSTYTGSILAEYQTQLTGRTRVCTVIGNCGINCEAIMTQSECPDGATSCYTGENCTTETEQDWNRCDLGSEADCLASDPEYTYCEAESDMDCDTTCDGGKDPETGACLGTETTSCSTDDYFECYKDIEVTSCDREKYRCEETEEVLVTTGSATYTSPITSYCASNTIILMSDGSPNASAGTSETEAVREEVKALIGTTDDCAPVAGQVDPVTEYNTLADGRCGPELVEHLATVDQSSSVTGDNVVNTYTVGFAVDDRPEAKAYLESLAAAGNGKYFPANDSAALAAAFMSILQDTLSTSRSFAAPVYTVDTDSLIANSDDIYLPLFQNTDFPAWAGNIKKFKLNDAGEIVDAAGDAAFDANGSLKSTAVDYWMPTGATATANDDPITSGGFANNLTPASRKILVDEGNALKTIDTVTNLKGLLGDTSMSDAKQNTLVNYIKGFEDDGTTARLAIGDILHSEPTFISYSNNKGVLFFGTNEGYLHAIDAADAVDGGGVEKFAFMPSSLLSNVEALKENAPVTDGGLTRIYGVDGGMMAFITDANNNGIVDSNDGDTATLVFGLRRGGNEYYALDVSDPDAPKLKWKINNTGDFAKLGETWSKPKAAKLRYVKGGSSALTDVLVFGGGYDNRLDEETVGSRSADAQGNAVFIVELETGDLIWSTDNATGTKPSNSIPSDIRTLDMDDDGSIDRLYFGDTGGNIWRVDLTAYDNDTGRTRYDVRNNSQITKFADFSGSGSDKRKFFFEPDVSVFQSGGEEVLIVAIGSGYRPHPLNENIADRFYVLSDADVRTVPSPTGNPLDDSDLEDVSTLNGDSFFPDNKGWYMDLTKGSGEKVLASPLIFLSKVSFTTFTVGDSSTTINDNGCSVTGSNIASIYVLDLMTGAATVDLDGDGDIDEDDTDTEIPNGNILDTPQLVFNEPTNCTTDGCNYFVDLRVGNVSTPIIDKDTVGANNDLGNFLPKVYWLSK